MARHLLVIYNLKFVTLGKFPSDAIEGRFGWCRQSCGGSYQCSNGVDLRKISCTFFDADYLSAEVGSQKILLSTFYLL